MDLAYPQIELELKIQELWRAGRLNYKRKPIQRRLTNAFRSCQDFLFVSHVARQTGKSYNWVIETAETCIQRTMAHARYGTAFQTDLEEFIMPIWQMVCEDAPSDMRPIYKTKGSKWYFPSTGSESKLFGIDKNPNGVRGNANDLIVIDEAGFCDKLAYVFSIIIAMLRHRPHLRVIMSSSSPETPDHEFWDFIERAKLAGAFFKATIDDDETCTEQTKALLIKEAGGRDSTTYRRELLCERVVETDLAIIPEWNDKYIQEVPRDEFFPYYHRYVSMDLGVVDFTAILFGYYDFKKATLIIEDEAHMRGPSMTTDKLALLIKEKEFALWGNSKVHLRIADNNNPLLLNDLAAHHNLNFIPTNKDELPAMVNEHRLLVNSGRYLVDPKCKMLIGCHQGGIYNDRKVKREFARSKVYGHYDHMASQIYMTRNVDQFTNPIPNNYGISAHDHWINPSSNMTQQQAAWGVLQKKKFVANRKAN